MVNFGPLAAEIVLLVWGTPHNFNGFRVLAVLLHCTLVVGVSQTASLNRGRHLYSAGRPSHWALAHILVHVLSAFVYMNDVVLDSLTQPPLSELFKASDDEWKCKVCCVQNSVTSDECVNCKANRLHVSLQDTGNVAKVSKLCAVVYVVPSLLFMFVDISSMSS